MLFRMVTPRRSRSGSITARKAIPRDVRAEYQRLYGPGWEAKLSVPAGTRPAEAKVRISEWTAEVETPDRNDPRGMEGRRPVPVAAPGVRPRGRMVRLVRR